MIKIAFILTSILLALFPGCNEEFSTRRYDIWNVTNYEVELIIYESVRFRDSVKIHSGEKFHFGITDEFPSDTEPNDAMDADSVVLVFHGEKMLTYLYRSSKRIPLSGNILDFEAYQEIGEDQYVFLIDNREYDAAVDID